VLQAGFILSRIRAFDGLVEHLRKVTVLTFFVGLDDSIGVVGQE
jgi:hypothetical protein